MSPGPEIEFSDGVSAVARRRLGWRENRRRKIGTERRRDKRKYLFGTGGFGRVVIIPACVKASSKFELFLSLSLSELSNG